MKRKVISIDESKCDGCGLCANGCPEAAIQMIDGKARFVSAVHCDGLGACVGECPRGAIRLEEREAEAYDEVKTLENIIPKGKATVLAHLRHLKSHGQREYLGQALEALERRGMPVAEGELDARAAGGCPGSRGMSFEPGAEPSPESGPSQLRQWPVQLKLLPVRAPFFDGCDLLVAADCVGFSHAGFHAELLRGKVLVILCPKLDGANEEYLEKLTMILSSNDIRSVTVAHMEVPCCSGTFLLVQEALKRSGKPLAPRRLVVTIKGQVRG